MIAFIVNSQAFLKFLLKCESYTKVHAKGNNLIFSDDNRDYEYYASDVRCTEDRVIDISRVRYDWLKKDLDGLQEQPLTITITSNKISFGLSY